MLAGTLAEQRASDESPLEIVNLCIIHSFVQQTFTERQEPSTLPSPGDGKKSKPPCSPDSHGCVDKQAVSKLLSSGQGLGEPRGWWQGSPGIRKASRRRQEQLKHDNRKALARPKAEREQEGKDKEDKMTCGHVTVKGNGKLTGRGLGLGSAAGDQEGEGGLMRTP